MYKVTAPRGICKILGLGGAEFHADFQDMPVLFPPQPQALWATFALFVTCMCFIIGKRTDPYYKRRL